MLALVYISFLTLPLILLVVTLRSGPKQTRSGEIIGRKKAKAPVVRAARGRRAAPARPAGPGAAALASTARSARRGRAKRGTPRATPSQPRRTRSAVPGGSRMAPIVRSADVEAALVELTTATKRCPDCAGTVSHDTAVCPACNYRFTSTATSAIAKAI